MLIREFLTLPPRSRKPREAGITLVLDKGIGLRQMEDLLASAADYVDLVKLGWGTGYITHDTRDKIKLYQQAGIPVYFGGTLLEMAILQDRFDEYREMALSLGCRTSSLSTGIIDLSVAEKVRYIRELRRISSWSPRSAARAAEGAARVQVGGIHPVGAGRRRVEGHLRGRESGTVGLFHTDGEVKSGVVDEIMSKIDPSRLIFEAPQKPSRCGSSRSSGPT
jgi:phosphosulfolactate synthase